MNDNDSLIGIGIVLFIVGLFICGFGWFFKTTENTQIVNKMQVIDQHMMKSTMKYYYVTADNVQHEVDVVTYNAVPQQGTWTHEVPSSTGRVILIVGAIVAIIGAFLIAPDLVVVFAILEGCS